MNIGWITVRKSLDFCSTTTHALSRGLIEKGHHLVLFSPDKPALHAQSPWTHVHLNQSKIRGLHARSVAKSAEKWFIEHGPSYSFELIIVDWPLLPRLAPVLKGLGIPIALMDRSPPADRGLLSGLQWISWNRAWSCVSKEKVKYATVVSRAHADFVRLRHNVHDEALYIIEAGVDIKRFKPSSASDTKTIRLVYHGRLDRHRGVLALPMLCQRIRQSGFQANLTLIGEGDASNGLQKIAKSNDWMSVLPSQSHEALAPMLSQHDIGLLPMPPSKVWAIASPLKRSEYLASGLLVLGIDHDGHRLRGSDKKWFCLIPKQTFHDDAVAWVSQLSKEEISEGKRLARKFAEDHCSWQKSIDVLERLVQSSKMD